VCGMLALAACSPAKTVAYYKANPGILEKRLTECVAKFDHSQDCNSARQAYGELHNAPVTANAS
jgi:hypothetical protein